MSNVTSDVSSNSTLSIDMLARLEMYVCVNSFTFGIPTHIYVIFLIVTGTGSGVAAEFFILNLTLNEIGLCLLCFFNTLSNWFSGFVAVADFLQGLGITGRPLFQCLICVERYLAVLHPVTFLKLKPLRYRIFCCLLAWMAISGSCVLSMFLLVNQSDVGHSWFFALQFLLYFSVQSFCLVRVLRALKQSGPGDRAREEENHMKQRAFRIILITTVNMVVICVPYIVTGIDIAVSKKRNIALWIFALACYAAAGFVQPVLFLHRNGKLCCCSS